MRIKRQYLKFPRYNKQKEMGIPDHLTCLLRNVYAGQEATVRTVKKNKKQKTKKQLELHMEQQTCSK